ncbi:hypothetical protein FB451DRAFT_1194287 [Mycena latifolia]|nr:hypothetical protein FB451DRAFT_1194287 [Mycena latifolia]
MEKMVPAAIIKTQARVERAISAESPTKLEQVEQTRTSSTIQFNFVDDPANFLFCDIGVAVHDPAMPAMTRARVGHLLRAASVACNSYSTQGRIVRHQVGTRGIHPRICAPESSGRPLRKASAKTLQGAGADHPPPDLEKDGSAIEYADELGGSRGGPVNIP